MVDLAIQGINGRMGHVLISLLAERTDCRIVAGIDPFGKNENVFPVYKTIHDMQETPDVLIDFSNPDATLATLAYCAQHNLPCVVCTTGLGDTEKAAMREAATKTAVFYSANMSLGINLLTELARRAQAMLPGFDIEIIEKHHHNKLDAPSGTALALADAINEQAGGRYNYVYDRHEARQKRSPDEIGLHAVRGGSIVGEHDVLFAGPDEVVTLSHQAYSRSVFATGAITAALFLTGQAAGTYSMSNLMNAL